MEIFRRYPVDRQKGSAETVNGFGAAVLPSPARRSALQFNPFLNNKRNHLLQPAANESAGMFHKILSEGSSRTYPSELRFRTNLSGATSEDSTCDLDSLASFSTDFHNSKESIGVSFLEPRHETYRNGKNEGISIANEEAGTPKTKTKKASVMRFWREKSDKVDAPERIHSFRNLLRRTSKRLKSIIPERRRSTQAGTGRGIDAMDFHRAIAKEENGPKLTKKYSPAMEHRALQRDLRMFDRLEDRGPFRAPASLVSRKNRNRLGCAGFNSMDECVYAGLGKDITKHAVDVEKFMNEMAFS